MSLGSEDLFKAWTVCVPNIPFQVVLGPLLSLEWAMGAVPSLPWAGWDSGRWGRPQWEPIRAPPARLPFFLSQLGN